MKLSRIIILVSTLTLSIASFAQETSAGTDSRLLVKYDMEYINNLTTSQPEAVEYLNFFVNNCFRIIDIPEKEINSSELKKINPKTGEIVDEEITTEDLENFNIYLYNYHVSKDKRTYYTIGQTGKLLIVLSDDEISKLYSNIKK